VRRLARTSPRVKTLSERFAAERVQAAVGELLASHARHGRRGLGGGGGVFRRLASIAVPR